MADGCLQRRLLRRTRRGDHRVLAAFNKGTNVERVIDAIPNYGSGPPRDLFVLRGVAKGRAQGYPKTAILVELVELLQAEETVAERPKGRDWHVLAGASGGDGSREKPFKDPVPGDREGGEGRPHPRWALRRASTAGS